MSAIYFPLRTNGSWFADLRSVERLERRLKQSFLTYDELVFEGGEFSYNASKDFASSWHVPNRFLKDPERTLKIDPPGTAFEILMAESGSSQYHKLGGGPSEVGFSIDYWPLLKKAGLLDQDYTFWAELEPNRQEAKFIDESVRRDKEDPRYTDVLPENRHFRVELVKSLYHDSVIARNLQMPFCVDVQTSQFVKRKSEHAVTFMPDPTGFVHRAITCIGLPDFREFSWDELHRIRNSNAGADFRGVLTRISERIRTEMCEFDIRQLEVRAIQEVSRELLAEVRRNQPTLGGLVLAFIVNLLPGGIGISTALDLHRFAASESSWVSLMDWRD